MLVPPRPTSSCLVCAFCFIGRVFFFVICMCFVFFSFFFTSYLFSRSRTSRASVVGGRKALFRFLFSLGRRRCIVNFCAPEALRALWAAYAPDAVRVPHAMPGFVCRSWAGYSVGLARQEPGRHTSALFAVLATWAYDSSAYLLYYYVVSFRGRTSVGRVFCALVRL